MEMTAFELRLADSISSVALAGGERLAFWRICTAFERIGLPDHEMLHYPVQVAPNEILIVFETNKAFLFKRKDAKRINPHDIIKALQPLRPQRLPYRLFDSRRAASPADETVIDSTGLLSTLSTNWATLSPAMCGGVIDPA